MHGDFFEVCFEALLIPELDEYAVIILDNASFHRKKRLYEIAERYQLRLIFLPPYSPELKKTTADTLKNSPDFYSAIFTAFQLW